MPAIKTLVHTQPSTSCLQKCQNYLFVSSGNFSVSNKKDFFFTIWNNFDTVEFVVYLIPVYAY